MQQSSPVISVTVVDTVPAKVPRAVCVAWEPQEEWWAIKSVLLPELGELFGRCLFAEYRNGWIARHEFNQQSDQRDYRPNHEQQNTKASQRTECFMLYVRPHLRRIPAR
jgi:hypothetical protein